MKQIEQPFSPQHLPLGIVRYGANMHLCVRLEDYAISLDTLRTKGLLGTIPLTQNHTRGRSMKPLLNLPKQALRDLRARLEVIFGQGAHLNHPSGILELAPYPEDDPRVMCPVEPGDFVDFYCSRHHAFRVGTLFRGPENALPAQYFHLPIGYHGRTSTVRGSGVTVTRPKGIVGGDVGPVFRPSRRLDYELEMGVVLFGCDHPVTPDEAMDLIFGIVLLNDWSARDIQSFEYRPLGPFLGKSFATSVAAWITPWEAFTPWRKPNQDSDHEVLPHLQEEGDNHLDVPLWAHLHSSEGEAELCRTNLANLAWSVAQMISHLSSNGTIIRPGDLIATGTISGPEDGAEGCLLEKTQNGKVPLPLQGGGSRTFLEDGDTVTLMGGHFGVGLAPCRATIS